MNKYINHTHVHTSTDKQMLLQETANTIGCVTQLTTEVTITIIKKYSSLMDGSIDVRKPQLLFYDAIMGQCSQWNLLLRVVKDRSVSCCLQINLRTLISQGVRPASAASTGKAHQRGGLQVPSALISPPISLKLKRQMGNWFLAPLSMAISPFVLRTLGRLALA